MTAARSVTDGTGTLPEEAYAVALASVPGVGPRTLRSILADTVPSAAWAALVAGKVRFAGSRPVGDTAARARNVDVAAVWRAHADAGVGVRTLGRPGYPAVLAADPQAPAVLFSLGDTGVLDASPRVAVVGTRSATRYGLGVAAQLGADLAASGVAVVSGLALGIDGAAHEGAVAAWRAARGDDPEGRTDPGDRTDPDGGTDPGGDPDPGGGTDPDGGTDPEGDPDVASFLPRRAGSPVAVVAGGVTFPYPRQHAGLWRRVAEAGVVVSESPIGAADLAWRFPARNRIIAALSDVVVVVECHSRGGSLHTVQAAAARGVPVGAVPGSVRSPASAGTNALLADGCFVVRDASDVLVAVGLSVASAGLVSRRVDVPADPGRDGDLPSPTREVASAVGWELTGLDEILERTGLEMDVVCGALERLDARGVLHGEGGWWERA